ncbi:MAG: response regulator [Desulfobacteraceae bacterium]|nr:response regulator [Desulfobacteraceae bacterium]
MTYAKCNILFVDDAPDILKAIRRIMKSEPYHCFFASGGDEAIALLAEKENDFFQVVITDMRMPPPDGQEVVSHIEKHYPQIVKIIISGWDDSDTIIKAVNTGRIHSYIIKPWDNRELKIRVKQALDIYLLNREKQILFQKLEDQNKYLEHLVLERTQKLLKVQNEAMLGKYAAQIVHNLNNPLHAVSGALEMLELMFNRIDTFSRGKIAHMLSLAQSRAHDLKHIISGILQNVRVDACFELMPVNVNAIIKKELDYFELNPALEQKTKKDIQLDPELAQVMGNTVQIKQIINNLISNAIDAMEAVEEKQLSIKTYQDSTTIYIKISDNGMGIPAKNQPYIFDSNFTTKPCGKGTGLGLASVKTMVEAYSGDIDVVSEHNRGSTFVVRLPITQLS